MDESQPQESSVPEEMHGYLPESSMEDTVAQNPSEAPEAPEEEVSQRSV